MTQRGRWGTTPSTRLERVLSWLIKEGMRASAVGGEASEKEKEMTSTRGAAIAAAEGSEETRMAHEDLGVIREVEKEGMNKE